MPMKAKLVSRGLKKKGFQIRKGKDKFYHLYVDGVKTSVFTKISHGEDEIHDGLLGPMSRQCHLSRDEFNNLVACPMAEDDYIALLRRKGILDPPRPQTPPSA